MFLRTKLFCFSRNVIFNNTIFPCNIMFESHILFNSYLVSSLLVGIMCFIIYHYWYKRGSNSLPGKRGLPLLGLIFSLGKYMEQIFSQWGKIYGPLYGIKVGPFDVVVIGSSEVAYEAFVKNDCFNDRVDQSLPMISDGFGVVNINRTDFHKEQRRFCLNTLRDLGMGRRNLEPKIIEAVDKLCDEIDSLCNESGRSEPFTLTRFMHTTTSRIISCMVFNRDVTEECEYFQRSVSENNDENRVHEIRLTFMAMAPFLRKIPPFSSTYKSGMKLRESLHDEIREEIKRHQETLDLDNPRDFIDHFLNEMNKRASHNDATKSEEEISIKPSVEDDEEISSDWERYSSFHLNQLKSLVRDLFLAGTDTTANAVAWLIIYLCKYPEVQVKLQNEVDSVFGTDGVPAMSKMRQLPYLRGIIQETSRIRPIVPLSLPHKASRDARLLGYCIPKGAIILTNIWAIHHDETKWPDPETFLPERHLDDGGNFVKSSDWMVFGVGPRGCLGQQLANMELCIMTVLLFRRFTFSLAPGEQPDMAGRSGIILKPPDTKVIAQRRNG